MQSELVRCPNCGQYAQRSLQAESGWLETECAHCDYLMILHPPSGQVIEAYAPGLYP